MFIQVSSRFWPITVETVTDRVQYRLLTGKVTVKSYWLVLEPEFTILGREGGAEWAPDQRHREKLLTLSLWPWQHVTVVMSKHCIMVCLFVNRILFTTWSYLLISLQQWSRFIFKYILVIYLYFAYIILEMDQWYLIHINHIHVTFSSEWIWMISSSLYRRKCQTTETKKKKK